MSKETLEKKPEVIEEPEKLVETFEVEIKHDDGKFERAVFVYNTDLMSATHRFDAKDKCTMFNRIYMLLPETPNDYKEIMNRHARKYAVASLLVKKKDDGTYEKYNPNLELASEALDYIFGDDIINRLEGCLENFMNRSRILSAELIVQQNDLNKLVEGNPVIAATMERAAMQAVTNAIETPIGNFTEMIQQIKNLGNFVTPKSSGQSPSSTASKGKKS